MQGLYVARKPSVILNFSATAEIIIAISPAYLRIAEASPRPLRIARPQSAL